MNTKQIRQQIKDSFVGSTNSKPKGEPKMTNPNKTIEKITVYWDTQNPDDKGWAYRTNIDSGPIDFEADDNLNNAIIETCRFLGVALSPDDFAVTQDGGVEYAIWQQSEEK